MSAPDINQRLEQFCVWTGIPSPGWHLHHGQNVTNIYPKVEEATKVSEAFELLLRVHYPQFGVHESSTKTGYRVVIHDVPALNAALDKLELDHGLKDKMTASAASTLITVDQMPKGSRMKFPNQTTIRNHLIQNTTLIDQNILDLVAKQLDKKELIKEGVAMNITLTLTDAEAEQYVGDILLAILSCPVTKL